LIIYPNPASEKLTLSLTKIKPESKVEIFDVTGKLIYLSSIQERKTEINTKNFVSGIYFLKVTQDDLSITRKIIIE
jgi:hypothetical protein